VEKTIHMATGLSISKEKLRDMAAVIATMTRQFNINEGLTSRDDRLPRRLHQEAPPKGQVLSIEEMDLMLKDYYSLRGWDAEGVPTP
jgi:aldehyde:ferredoxin oxidoreductase